MMKRVLAWIGIVVLAGLYIVTLITAFLDSPAMAGMFWASLYCTIMVPIILYIILRLHDFNKKRRDKFIDEITEKEGENKDE